MPRLYEKRSAPRVTTVVPATCEIHQGSTLDLPSHRAMRNGESSFAARTINVSHNGILINSDVDLHVGVEIGVSLRAPNDGHLIRVVTQVAWSRRNAINLFGHYAAGLKIKKIAAADRDTLKGFFKQ